MLQINKQISELDLGDQIILEKGEKTLSFNSVGRLIYLQLKEGKSAEDIAVYLNTLYGTSSQYYDDIINFINQLLELGVVENIG